MKSVDAFARPIQEFQVKTNVGGYLSLCSFALIVALFVTELRYFLQLEAKDEMVIDQNQDQKYLTMRLNVSFASVPCSVLHLNVFDPKQLANAMHVSTEIYKTRLAPGSGEPFGRRLRDSLADTAQTPSELLSAGLGGASAVGTVRTADGHQHGTLRRRCPSCHESRLDEDECCFTCDEVKRKFQAAGLDDRPRDYAFSQCAEEAYADKPPRKAEGCRVEASLKVRKVPAVLHIGVGRQLQQALVPMEDEDPTEYMSSLDFSHEVEGLAFGPHFPGLVDVLEGRRKTDHKPPYSEHYQYDVHVIPTSYMEDGMPEVVSHQYSVTEYTRTVNARLTGSSPSAVGFWLSYDFTPFEVRKTRSRKSLWHFLTECCAILGGIFAFTGILDKLAYRLNRALSSAGRRVGLGMPLTDGKD